MPKNRDLLVLTRKQGVRVENPLLTLGKYYPSSRLRTPELRQEADELVKPITRPRQVRSKALIRMRAR